MMPDRVAVVVGVTGIVGLNLSKLLLTRNWKVYGISRRKPDYLPQKVHHVSVDLTDAIGCKTALQNISDVKYAFYTTWQVRLKNKETCKVNKIMIENFIDNLPCKLNHFALVTGTRHYMNFTSFAALEEIEEIIPFTESQPRLSFQNFYYELEDVLFDRAKKREFTWSVARPSTIIGFSQSSIVNEGISIAVYATICKHLNLPFIYPGTKTGYKVFLDATDVNLLAEHLLWEATTDAAQNEAFNVSNGDICRWKFLWPKIGEYFGIKAEAPSEEPINLIGMMQDKEPVWKEIVTKYGLKETKISELVSDWFYFVGNLSLPVSRFSDMSKSREMGFLHYQKSEKSFFRLFVYLRQNKYIPNSGAGCKL